MAISKSKPHILPTQSPIPVFLVIFSALLLLLNNAKSQSPLSGSETISFGFSFFEPDDGINSIVPLGDASISGGVLHLTNQNELGKPLPQSVGQAAYFIPVHIWDKSGKVADFSTGFSFVVNPKGFGLHGDGLTFFLAEPELEFPSNSTGGFLGIYDPKTALQPQPSNKTKVLAVEFDSFSNEWDPKFNGVSQFPHIGINANSVRSLATVAWPIDLQPDGVIAHASINYNGESKSLGVFVSYPGTNSTATVSFNVDLRAVLPEWVRVGFSAATGELVETHDILSWSFEAAL